MNLTRNTCLFEKEEGARSRQDVPKTHLEAGQGALWLDSGDGPSRVRRDTTWRAKTGNGNANQRSMISLSVAKSAERKALLSC